MPRKRRRAFAFLPSPFIPHPTTERSTRRPSAICRVARPSALLSSNTGLSSPPDLNTGSDLKLFHSLSASRAESFLRVLRNRTRHVTFVLDGVHGAHNLAAIARTCDAFGVQDLHVISQQREDDSEEKCQEAQSLLDRFKHETSMQRVSKNAHKWISIVEHDSVEGCVAEMRKNGYKIIVSSLSSQSKPANEIDISDKCAFVFGNEKDGVTSEMQQLADAFFTIPMVGFVESMNVSVAVATTAAMTIPRCFQSVRCDRYLLSTAERRQLAHQWLVHRFSQPKAPPKPLPSRQDVTKLGHEKEKLIVEDGLFLTNERVAQAQSKDRISTNSFRLAPETGDVLASYFAKRKFGALNDIGYERRCEAFTYGTVGTHTLSCEAIAAHLSVSLSRRKLLPYFTSVCSNVHAIYAPYFDEFGSPTLSHHAPESHETFSNLAVHSQRSALPVCIQIASEVFDIKPAQLTQLLRNATNIDLLKCISSTTRLSAKEEAAFLELVARSSGNLQDLETLLSQREPERPIHDRINFPLRNGNSTTSKCSNKLLLLQICLRLSHAAFLCSQMHQTKWERASVRYSDRARSRQFALLESIISDAATEMKGLGLFEKLGATRIIFEYDHALFPLQQAIDLNETVSMQ